MRTVAIGEGKSSQSLGDQIVASGGIVLSEFPTDVSNSSRTSCYHVCTCKQVCASKTFLLADKPRRTAKYLLALAGGVPCVQPSWAKDCLKQVYQREIRAEKCSDTCQHKMKFVLTFSKNDMTIVENILWALS